MSFVTPAMKEALKGHILEEALPFGHGFLAYYMRDPDQGRMMSTLFVFTPEGIAIMGDLCPEGPGNGGSISSYGYGIGWFGSEKSEYYLCEKFLRPVYQTEVAARFVREHIEEIKKDKGEEIKRVDEWKELLGALEGGEMGPEHFHEALQDLDYEHEDEGYEYNLRTAGWLCALQQRFVELYAKVPVLHGSTGSCPVHGAQATVLVQNEELGKQLSIQLGQIQALELRISEFRGECARARIAWRSPKMDSSHVSPLLDLMEKWGKGPMCSHRWGLWIKSSDRDGQEFKRCENCTILEYRPMTEKRNHVVQPMPPTARELDAARSTLCLCMHPKGDHNGSGCKTMGLRGGCYCSRAFGQD